MAGIISVPSGMQPAATRPTTTSDHPELEPDTHYNFPVPTMLGDGILWSLQNGGTTRLEMGPDPRAPTVRHISVPRFRRLLAEVGVGIRRDILLLKRFFLLLNPVDEIIMPPWIDLGTITIAAGWTLQARGMTVLGVQVTGTLMNKLVSTGDDLWGDTWDRILDSLIQPRRSQDGTHVLCSVDEYFAPRPVPRPRRPALPWRLEPRKMSSMHGSSSTRLSY